MKKLKSIPVILLMAASLAGNAQDNQSIPLQSENPTLIAVADKANWCPVCKSSGKNFGELAEAPGIVTFINPETHKQLMQLRIAIADEEMKLTIETLLKL